MHKTRFQLERTRFSAFNVVFAQENAFKRKEMLALAIVTLFLHNLMRLHVSQSFHCVKTDNVHKTRF